MDEPGRSAAVAGPRHPRVAELLRLVAHPARAGSFVLEGPRAVGEAIDAGLRPVTVVVPESAGSSGAVDAVRNRLPGSVEQLVVRDKVFGRLAPSVSPQPMLAILTRPHFELPGRLDATDVVLVLVDIADPGNVGTLVRVADAVGARCVICSGGADPWGDKAVRSSAGSVLRVPVLTVPDVEHALGVLRSAGATIVGTDVSVGEPLDSGALGPPVAIVLGSEAHGLRGTLREALDRLVSIDMPGRAESLNVAMAGTLLAFESRRKPPA